MTQAGLRIPLPWGHNSRAVPLDPNDPNEEQFLSSRYNAGYVSELAADNGRLRMTGFDAPGLAVENGNLVAWTKLGDGREVKTAIGEVSVGIAKKFTDGKGRVWNDVITHVAVTPHPVWSGQDGFASLGGLAGRVEGLQNLAIGESAMADENAIFDDDLEAAPAVDADMNMPAETVEINMEKLLPALGEHGIVLPEGTDEDNLIERLFVAITALQGKLSPAGGAADPADDPGPVSVQEPDAVLMSLLAKASRVEKLVLQSAIDERRSARESARTKRAALIRKQIDRHAGAGIPRDVLKKHFGDEPGVQHLSLMARPTAGKELTAFEAKLSLLKDLKPYLLSKRLTTQLATATELPNPAYKPGKAAQESLTDEMAKSVGC